MASANITIRAVQALQKGEAIWDAGHKEAVRGFGVRRQRDKATYVVKYRIHGNQRFVTIGPHGSPWTPDTARKEAKKLLGQVADGKDPADAKAEARAEAGETLRKVAGEYLVQAKKRLRPKTYSEVERYLLTAWKPLHRKSVFVIRRRHITARLAEIETESGPTSASRARTALSGMFAWAIREGYELVANPVAGTNRPAQPDSRDRVLSDAELAEVWAASGDDDYGRIVRLLILTAQRRDEVGGMFWPELDTVQDRWTIPSTRTKNHREHILPLVPTAVAQLPARRNDRDFVFGDGPRRKDDNRQCGFSGWSKSKAALDSRITATRKKISGEDAELMPRWTLHDLRRTAATMMADRLGVLPHIVEAILNHVSGHRAGVAGVYNRARYEGEMREALERWAGHVAGLHGHD